MIGFFYSTQQAIYKGRERTVKILPVLFLILAVAIREYGFEWLDMIEPKLPFALPASKIYLPWYAYQALGYFMLGITMAHPGLVLAVSLTQITDHLYYGGHSLALVTLAYVVALLFTYITGTWQHSKFCFRWGYTKTQAKATYKSYLLPRYLAGAAHFIWGLVWC